MGTQADWKKKFSDRKKNQSQPQPGSSSSSSKVSTQRDQYGNYRVTSGSTATPQEKYAEIATERSADKKPDAVVVTDQYGNSKLVEGQLTQTKKGGGFVSTTVSGGVTLVESGSKMPTAKLQPSMVGNVRGSSSNEREVKYFTGEIPRKDTQVREYSQLSPEERASLLPNQYQYYSDLGLGKGTPESYSKFKPKSFLGQRWNDVKDVASLYLWPVHATIQMTGADKAYEWTLEKGGQGLAWGADIFNEVTRPAKTTTEFLIDPVRASFKYNRESLTKSFDVKGNVKSTLNKDYSRAGVYYKTGVDLSLSFIYPVEKTIYEGARQDRINGYELGTLALMGGAWAAGTKVIKFGGERILASRAYEGATSFWPKGAKLFSYGVKGVEVGIEWKRKYRL